MYVDHVHRIGFLSLVALLFCMLLMACGSGATGMEILLSSERDGDSEIFVMNSDASGVVQLTDNEVADFDPDWSPDGRAIVFTTQRGGGVFEICTVVVDDNAFVAVRQV